MFNVMVHGLHGLFLGFDGRRSRNKSIHSFGPAIFVKNQVTYDI
jgi:hypothetical protein